MQQVFDAVVAGGRQPVQFGAARRGDSAAAPPERSARRVRVGTTIGPAQSAQHHCSDQPAGILGQAS
jgi:hypothetical protein